jgi:hypothetical protein
MRSFDAIGTANRIRSAAVISKTTRITIETEALMIVHRGRTVVTWCPKCKAEVEAMLLDVDTAAAELLRGLPGGTPHIWTTREGKVQLCLPSLTIIEPIGSSNLPQLG